jgi:hypothetical protein
VRLVQAASSCALAAARMAEEDADASKGNLETLWQSGRNGSMCPLEQLRAFAYRAVMRELGVPEHGMYTKIAAKVVKVGGGAPTGQALSDFFGKVDEDPEWFPGKVYRKRNGPPPALNGAKRQCVARSAEALKKSGLEPTFALICASCPRAILNPETDEPVDKKIVYDVLRTECYDDGADEPWDNRARLQKTALPEIVRVKRHDWGKYIVGLKHSGQWYYTNVLWTDLCNSILPRTEVKAKEQALARKGGKGWMSPGSQEYSKNLRGRLETIKQNSWDTEKVWWAPFLAHGKLHVELLPSNFPGECPEGAAILASKVPAVLNTRFPTGRQPKTIMTDRGRGFFHPGTGGVTPEYKNALHNAGLRAFMGDDAAKQPGHLQEVLLHETAVSWLRVRLQLSLPRQPWTETREQHGDRLREACRYINANHDVEGLCRALPERLRQLIERKGDRLRF